MNFDPAKITERLQSILALIKDGTGAEALPVIESLVSELRTTEGEEHTAQAPEPSRLIAAHLKAAQVQIEQTHISPAQDSIEQALYVSTHEQAAT